MPLRRNPRPATPLHRRGTPTPTLQPDPWGSSVSGLFPEESQRHSPGLWMTADLCLTSLILDALRDLHPTARRSFVLFVFEVHVVSPPCHLINLPKASDEPTDPYDLYDLWVALLSKLTSVSV